MLGSGRGPREGDAIAKQVTSVGYVEKKEGGFSPPPPFFFFFKLIKYHELSKCFSTPSGIVGCSVCLTVAKDEK